MRLQFLISRAFIICASLYYEETAGMAWAFQSIYQQPIREQSFAGTCILDFITSPMK